MDTMKVYLRDRMMVAHSDWWKGRKLAVHLAAMLVATLVETLLLEVRWVVKLVAMSDNSWLRKHKLWLHSRCLSCNLHISCMCRNWMT
jgi:hypothetical protein